MKQSKKEIQKDVQKLKEEITSLQMAVTALASWIASSAKAPIGKEDARQIYEIVYDIKEK